MTESPYVPNARCYMKNNSGYYMLEAGFYEQLRADWMAGKAFFLADVECIQYCTIESQERYMERTRAEKKAAEPDSFQ